MKEQRIFTRRCGACTACCKPFAVPEVGKIDASWCQHRIPNKGCGIYADRPYACKAFKCLWLYGKGEPNDRPDVLGVIMVAREIPVDGQMMDVMEFYEMVPGALNKPRVLQLREAIKAQGIVINKHAIRPDTDKSYHVTGEYSKKHFTEYQIRRLIETLEAPPPPSVRCHG